jgi:hypothetical protein
MSSTAARKRLLRHHARLCEAWHQAFPRHDLGTGRLRRSSLDSFEGACDRADELARQQPVSAETLPARRLFSDDISLERAWYEINNPRNRPTPQSTVEAVIHSVRERGVAALDESANIERLRRCDVTALTLINRRIAKLKDGSHA